MYQQAASVPRIRCDPQRRWTLCIYRYPVWGQCGRRHPVEVLSACAKGGAEDTALELGATVARISTRPQPYYVVWRSSVYRIGWKKEIKCAALFKSRSTRIDIVTQLWSRAPQQSHRPSDVRRGHRRAAKIDNHCQSRWSLSGCSVPGALISGFIRLLPSTLSALDC